MVKDMNNNERPLGIWKDKVKGGKDDGMYSHFKSVTYILCKEWEIEIVKPSESLLK